MGLCLHLIDGDGPKMSNTNIRDIKGGFVWIVGRREPPSDPNVKADWHIQGVGTTENLALEMCVDENYFIGPLPLNTALPHKTVQWVGLYFPFGAKLR